MTVDILTTTQLWQAPPNVYSVDVAVWGSGASGQGRAASVAHNGGSGSGSGGYSATPGVTVVPGVFYQVTIHQGGAPAIAGNNVGNAGGPCWFSTTGVAPVSTAEGALANGGNQGATVTAAGPGASLVGAIGITKTAGNAGDPGGSPGEGGKGGDAPNGGGAGGLIQTTPGTNGNPGTAPGGGGGGGKSMGGVAVAGGAGARGEVRLTYTPVHLLTTSLAENFAVSSGFQIRTPKQLTAAVAEDMGVVAEFTITTPTGGSAILMGRTKSEAMNRLKAPGSNSAIG